MKGGKYYKMVSGIEMPEINVRDPNNSSKENKFGPLVFPETMVRL